MRTFARRQFGVSNKALLGLIFTAFIVGIAGSLAVRAPGQVARAAAEGGIRLRE